MNVILRLARHLLLSLLAVGLAACSAEHQANTTGEPAKMARIEGSVMYRERMLLRPGAEIEVQLQDVSKADAMATMLAAVVLAPQGAPPYHFSIEYDPASIDPRMRYALRATISQGDRLLFASTDYIDPFQGNPVEILVRGVPAAMPEPVALEGVTWILRSLGGQPAAAGAGGKAVDILLTAGEQRVAGFSGCNRYSGGYVREGVSEHGSPLRFGPLAGTMMACEDGGELERTYLQALGRVTAFRLAEGELSLLAGPEVLATFTPS